MYYFLKIFIFFFKRVYFKKIYLNGESRIPVDKPTFIAANHPNGFLDGVIFSSLLKVPTYIFVRGDVFRKKWTNFVLRSLKLIPIFRVRDGNARESVVANYRSYNQLYGMFKRNKRVLIFPESDSHTVKRLRTLKKGTARIILDMESRDQKEMQVTVIPTGINYSFYKKFGKEIFVHINSPIYLESSRKHGMSDNEAMLSFTNDLHAKMKESVIHVPIGSEIEAEIGFEVLRSNKQETYKKIHHDSNFFYINHRLAELLQNDTERTFHKQLSAYQENLDRYELSHFYSTPKWWNVLLSIVLIVPSFIAWLPMKLYFSIGERIANKKVKLSELYDSVLFGVALVVNMLVDIVVLSILFPFFGWQFGLGYLFLKVFAIWYDLSKEILRRLFQINNWNQLKAKDASVYHQLCAQKDAILSKVSDIQR